jgi:hypothetical protein
VILGHEGGAAGNCFADGLAFICGTASPTTWQRLRLHTPQHELTVFDQPDRACSSALPLCTRALALNLGAWHARFTYALALWRKIQAAFCRLGAATLNAFTAHT